MQVPPPFAMAYTISLDIKETCQVSLNIEYLDREELEEDEIYDEGFTLDDDFEWAGELGKNWAVILENYFNDVPISPKSEDLNHWLYVETNNEGNKTTGHIARPLEHLNFLQQIVQACLEKAKREAPLMLELIVVSNSSKSHFKVRATFVEREFTINDKAKSWSDLEQLMSIIYFDEPEETKPSKRPNKEGYWIDYTAEGLYFKMKKLKEDKKKLLNEIIL